METSRDAARRGYVRGRRRYLSGVGVARQRKAIVDGLRNSIGSFTDNDKIMGGRRGASQKDVVDLLLLTQYFDMLQIVGSMPLTTTVYIPMDE